MEGTSQADALLQAGRFREALRLYELALAGEPPPGGEARTALLDRIIEIHAERLDQPERAAKAVEQLLALDPRHERARRVAEGLVAVPSLAGRMASVLAGALEVEGFPQDIGRYLAIALESARGPARAPLLTRLGKLRQDRLGDLPGALEAFGQSLALDLAGQEARTRYTELAVALDRHADAEKMLARVIAGSKDAATKARACADLGEVLLRAGDPRRARATLWPVVSSQSAPADAVLAAAKSMREILEAGASDPRALCQTLERIALLEPDAEQNRQANEALAALAEKLGDTARATAAYERLLSTKSRALALRALTPIYGASGDPLKRALLIEEQAKDAGDEEARAAMARAVDLRARAGDAQGALEGCRAMIARFGTALDVWTLYLPLLEAQQQWAELADALAREAGQVSGVARARLFARLGLTRIERLNDAPGGIEALREALVADPGERSARAALEDFVAAGEHRLAAARILEPVYRREGGGRHLLHVLELRGKLGGDADGRLDALREATELAIFGGETYAELALDLAERGLSEAVAAGRPVAEWIERFDRLPGPPLVPAQRAAILGEALGDRDASTVERSDLALGAADAYASAGETAEAIALFRRALAFDPLPRLAPLARRDLRVKIVQAAAAQGDATLAREHAAELLTDPALPAALLDELERAAEQIGDLGLTAKVLRRRAAQAGSPAEQVRDLERLGELEADLRGDPEAAARAWKEGARVAEGAGDEPTAMRLYRQAHQIAPADDEVTLRLATLVERTGAWRELPPDEGRRLMQWRAEQASAGERLDRLLAWARVEEEAFSDGPRALALYREALAIDPARREALSAAARLSLAAGDAGGTLEILGAMFAAAPDDAEACAVAAALLASEGARAEATSMLSRACDATKDTALREAVLTDLVEAGAGAPAERCAWFERLCDLRSAHGAAGAALGTALRGAREMPDAVVLWDRAAELARQTSRSEDVGAAYEEVLSRDLPADLVLALGERAVSFCDERFEDSSRKVRILERVLQKDPAADWALDRLQAALDAAERWEDLFALFDRRLASARGDARAALLKEAAQTAKDFADQPDRAIRYFEQLREMKPLDAGLSSALERLYERRGRHRELVALWAERLRDRPFAEVRRLRLRMAAVSLDALGDAPGSLQALEPLLESDATAPEKAEAAALLERILPASDAPVGRRAAERLLQVLATDDSLPFDPAAGLRIRKRAALAAAGMLGDARRAMPLLAASLEEDPGDVAVADALADAYEACGREREMHDLLVREAARTGDDARAARLSLRAALVAEARRGAPAGAEALHRRVVAVAPGATSFDALARLTTARGDHAAAAGWLEKLMAVVEPARHEEVGERLGDVYRRLEAWDRLAAVLADGAARAASAANQGTSIARLREAAALMRDRCADPVSAMVLLEEASELAPGDQAIRLELADAMRESRRFDDARAVLAALLDGYGGRRPRERAAVHHALARLELAQERPADALRELETASRIDPQNAAILRALAELAHGAGQLGQAERGYRALLALLKRHEDGGQAIGIARSEALLELSTIAGKQGDAPRARELLESALEAATLSAFERERLQHALRARGDTPTLARLQRAKDTAPV